MPGDPPTAPTLAAAAGRLPTMQAAAAWAACREEFARGELLAADTVNGGTLMTFGFKGDLTDADRANMRKFADEATRRHADIVAWRDGWLAEALEDWADAVRAGRSPPHPVWPLLDAFAALPLPAPAVHRNPDRGILMHSTQAGRLVDIPDPVPEVELPSLFGDPSPGKVTTSYLADWFRASARPVTGGRGVASETLHFVVEAFASLPLSCRDGRMHPMSLWIRACDAPPGHLSWEERGWAHGLDPSNLRRNWERHRRNILAADSLAYLRMPEPDDPSRTLRAQALTVLGISEDYRGGQIWLARRVSPEAAQGAAVEMRILRKLRYFGLHYRAYLSGLSMIDRFAKRGRLTRLIPAPLLDAEGKQQRGKGGRIRRETTPTLPNPIGEDIDLWVSGADLALAAGADPEARRKGGRRWRDAATRTIQAFEDLADESWCREKAGISPPFEFEEGAGMNAGKFRLWQRMEWR